HRPAGHDRSRRRRPAHGPRRQGPLHPARHDAQPDPGHRAPARVGGAVMGLGRLLATLRPGSARLGRDDDVRSHLLVERIENGVLHVRGHGPRIVLEASGVNFELKSHFEQLGLLEVMAELLQYLHDPIQILVRSRVYEPDEYFQTLEAWRRGWTGANRELRERRLAEYKEKILSVARDKQIKDRRFYVVVPFTRSPIDRL